MEDIRRRKSIKREQEQNEPKDCVHCFDRKLSCCEEQWKKRNMTGYCQRSESTKISPVSQCDQAEGDENSEDSFLMHMPAEEK